MLVMLTQAACGSGVVEETQLRTELAATSAEGPVVITENELGIVDGYDDELWEDYGNTAKVYRNEPLVEDPEDPAS